MNKTQKIIPTLLVLGVTAFCFRALLEIINVNQPSIFVTTAFWMWAFMWVFIVFLYDLHFKTLGGYKRAREKHAHIPESAAKMVKVCTDAFYDRWKHLFTWQACKQALHYLLLPGFIFWATAAIFYLELGHLRVQYIIALLSTVALTVNFMFIKEVFSRKRERVDQDVFVALSVVKVYTVALTFAATMGLMRSFCLDPYLFILASFSLTFLLIHQALYQHKLANAKNIFITLAISAVLGAISYYVYISWSYNFITAGIFFAAIYNLFWGTYHYHFLDHALTKKAFVEIFIICLFIAYMVASTTNFQARILDGCPFLR